jgi:AcrR family transcriptional regulator
MPTDTWWNLGEDKRARILDAAMAEFGSRGFSAGSLNVVARDAAIAKGSLFQYFDDKLELFTVACAVASDRIRDAVLDGLDDQRGFFPLLYDITDRWLDYFATHPLERGVAFAAAHEMDPMARAGIRAVTNTRFAGALAPLVQAAVERDEFGNGVDPDEIVAMVVLVLRHLHSAPFMPQGDPVLALDRCPPVEVHRIARSLIGALERAYVRADVDAYADQEAVS